MAVDSVNNNQGNYALLGAATGAATGAVAGGLYGWHSKPWLKDGNITDEFVKKADETMVNNGKKALGSFASDMKKLQETGEFSSLSGSTKEILEARGIELKDFEKASKDEIKAFAEGLLTESGAENWEEAAKALRTAIENSSYKALQERADKWKAITIKKDMTVDELKELCNKNKEFFEKEFHGRLKVEEITEATKGMAITSLETVKEIAIKAPEEDIKNSKEEIAKLFNSDKKSLKEFSKDSMSKFEYDAVKDTLKQLKKSAALKWGGIAAGAALAIGALTGYFMKKDPVEETQHVNAQA